MLLYLPMSTLSMAWACSVFVFSVPLLFPSATSPSSKSCDLFPTLGDNDSSLPSEVSSLEPCLCSCMSSWLNGFNVISWARGCTAADRWRRRPAVVESGTGECWSGIVRLSPLAFGTSPRTLHRHLWHRPAFVIFEPPLVVTVMSLLPSNHDLLWPPSSRNSATGDLEKMCNLGWVTVWDFF